MEGILVTLLTGGIAGWLAGKIIVGAGQGLLVNVAVGIVGAVIGRVLFSILGISVADGFAGSVLTASVGALVLLFLLNRLWK